MRARGHEIRAEAQRVMSVRLIDLLAQANIVVRAVCFRRSLSRVCAESGEAEGSHEHEPRARVAGAGVPFGLVMLRARDGHRSGMTKTPMQRNTRPTSGDAAAHQPMELGGARPIWSANKWPLAQRMQLASWRTGRS